MGKNRSQIAQEAREDEKKSAEVKQKIRQLSEQIADPQKHFGKKPNEKTQSTIERFRRYFWVGQTAVIEKRKPTRAELRAERNRAIFWAVFAFIVVIWLSNWGCRVLK